MNTNVGDMPIEIFGDYVSDFFDIEYSWEYLIPIVNGFCFSLENRDDIGCNFYHMHYGDAYYPTLGHGHNGNMSCSNNPPDMGSGHSLLQ